MICIPIRCKYVQFRTAHLLSEIADLCLDTAHGAGKVQVLLDVDVPTEHGGILRADSRLSSHFMRSKTVQMLRFDYSSTVLNTNDYLRRRPVRKRFSTSPPTSHRFSAS